MKILEFAWINRAESGLVEIAPEANAAGIIEMRRQLAQAEAELAEATDPEERDYDDNLTIACAKASVEAWRATLEIALAG